MYKRQDIMPAILAAALLMGLSGMLGMTGIFGEKSVVQMFPAVAGINRFVEIVSSSVFEILPLIVVYSATRRYGGCLLYTSFNIDFTLKI